MLNALTDILSYPFLIRALIVGVLVSLCAALLGVNLVLKRYSMIGDGLSHVGFGAMAVATVMNASPLIIAVPVCIVAAFVLLKINEKSIMGGDRAIAIVSSGALAIGVMVISMTSGVNTDIYNYMFGSILALNTSDMILCVILSVIVIAVYILFYNRVFAVTFDETFAKATGTKTGVYNTILAVLTAVTVVLGMRMMGALLISSLIVFPSMISMKLFGTYKRVVISSALVSVISFIIGLVFSYAYAAPTGASIVVINIVILGVVSVIRRN